jgi:transcriptional regulator with XRE-family HTH domain
MAGRPPQHEYLKDAMATLGLTRAEFADRVGTTRRALDNWLLQEGSSEFRTMPEMAWKFIGEILENSKK